MTYQVINVYLFISDDSIQPKDPQSGHFKNWQGMYVRYI